MSKRVGLRLVWTPVFLFLLISSSCLSATDLKIRTTIKMSDNSEAGRVTRQEHTLYVQGARERREILVPSATGTQQPHSAVIIDCERHHGYQEDLNGREYSEGPLPPFPS